MRGIQGSSPSIDGAAASLGVCERPIGLSDAIWPMIEQGSIVSKGAPGHLTMAW